MSDLYRVTTRRLCAGLLVEDGRVVLAAPILRWAVGKPLATVWAWVAKMGGTLERVGP